jgi:hypothetical protein
VAEEAAMSGLAEFLLARIADDETVARRNWDGLPVQAWSLNDDEGFASVCIAAPRVLAECEAKRRVAAEHTANYNGNTCAVCADPDLRGLPWPCPTLRLLALPYVDHPDFRSEWKP